MKLVCIDVLLANGDELNVILLKFTRPVYFFFPHQLLAFTEINIVR